MKDERKDARKVLPQDVLLVEDSSDAVLLAREALAENTSRIRELHVAADGVEALNFLRREGSYAGAPRPALILLDLTLPKKSGLQVLEEIKQDASLKDIPIIVLSTSEAEADIQACYKLHANAYVVKPIDYDEFCRSIESIVLFWCGVVTLPRSKEA